MGFTSKNDINFVQASDTAIIGADGGDDIYVITSSLLAANQKVTIVDTQGGNTLRLVEGLTITSSRVAADALLLTLSNGAEITLLKASLFSFGVGGDALGAGEVTQDFATFVTSTMGLAEVPPNNGTIIDLGVVTISNSPVDDTLLSQAEALSVYDMDIGALIPLDDEVADGMIYSPSTKWGETVINYSFNTQIPGEYYAYAGDKNLTDNWSQLNSIEMTAAREVVARLDELISASFFEVSGQTGEIRFNVTDQMITSGFAFYPGSGVGGDVFLATSNRDGDDSFVPGNQAYHTVLHETGHAMGLKHPFDAPTVPTGTDNSDYTVMSYTEARTMKIIFSFDANSAGYTTEWSASPDNYGVFDIAALQALYGADLQTRIGDDMYAVSTRDFEYLTIWDAGGGDTIDAGGATGDCTVDMNPGMHSTLDFWTLSQQEAETIAWAHEEGFNNDAWILNSYSTYADQLYTGENNLTIAYGVIIENVTTGSGNDQVTDNAVDNFISTGEGNDVIILGAGGFDTVDGGAGTDQLTLPVIRNQVQQEILGDGSLLLLAPEFAINVVGVESVYCADGMLTLLG